MNDTYINVKDKPFGAKGDNVADDTVAIQSAFDAALALTLDFKNHPYGLVLRFPSGFYRITAPILFQGAKHLFFKLRILGDGSTQSIIFQANPNLDIFRFEQTGAGYTGQLTFDSVQLNYGRHAICAKNLSYSTCQNVLFKGNGKHGAAKGSPSLKLEGNTIQFRMTGCQFLHGGDVMDVSNGSVLAVSCGFGEDVGNIRVRGGFQATGCNWSTNCVDRLKPDGLFDMGPASLTVEGGSTATITGCNLGGVKNAFINVDQANAVNLSDNVFWLLDGGTLVRSRRLFSGRGVAVRGGYARVRGAGNSLFSGFGNYKPNHCSIDGLRIGHDDGAEVVTVDGAFLDPSQRNYYGINPVRYPK